MRIGIFTVSQMAVGISYSQEFSGKVGDNKTDISLDISRLLPGRYCLELIMTEIDKIVEVEIENDDIMISPTDNRNRYSEDIVEEHISRDDAFINAKNKKGDYIIVPKVVGGEE